FFDSMLAGVDHLSHTYNLEHQAFSRGQPEWGVHLADELERIVALHGAETISAVIVEPMAGATGVLVPPKGYLERLQAICEKHSILLILDEVISGFGRLGRGFAADYFGIQPDILITAKGMTNGVVPMGAVIVRKKIHDAFMQGPMQAIELARLHLFGTSARVRCRLGDTRRSSRGGIGQSLRSTSALLGGCYPLVKRSATRYRSSEHWLTWRNRIGTPPGPTHRARLRSLREVLRKRRSDQGHRRYHHFVTPAD